MVDLVSTFLVSFENLATLNLSQNERIANRGATALVALSMVSTTLLPSLFD